MGQDQRLKFHDVLKDVLGTDQVYFQPPPDRNLSYPCIVYERENADVKAADNFGYHVKARYQVTYIDRLPDGDPIDVLAALPLSSFSRHFATSGLNHDVFSIYY